MPLSQTQRRKKRKRRNVKRRALTREHKIMVALGVVPNGATVMDGYYCYTLHKGTWRITLFGKASAKVSVYQEHLTQQYFDNLKKTWRA